MSQIFDILHKMDINWSIIKEYLNKEDQMLADNSRYVKRKMILLSFVQNLEKLISIYTSVHNILHILCSTTYMSQMLYAGQSAREIVTFFSDF